jgi:trehalose 6-phosphate synthase
MATADAMHSAIVMPVEDRRARWKQLDAAVREMDIFWWRKEFLAALDSIRKEP